MVLCAICAHGRYVVSILPPVRPLIRGLAHSSDTLTRATERLGSDLRVNRASDDPASLAVASSLEVSQRAYSQDVRNVNDSISMLTIAQSSLEQVSDALQRLGEISTQAANAVLSTHQRAA
jgi:flagellin